MPTRVDRRTGWPEGLVGWLLTIGATGLLCAAIAALMYRAFTLPVLALSRVPAAEPERSQPPRPPRTVTQQAAAPALTRAAAAASPRSRAYYPSDPAQLVRALAPLQREVSDGLTGLDRDGRCNWGDLFASLGLATGDGEIQVESVEIRRRPPPPDPDAPDHDPAAFASQEAGDAPGAACIRDMFAGRSFRATSARPGRRWQTFYSPALRPQ